MLRCGIADVVDVRPKTVLFVSNLLHIRNLKIMHWTMKTN